MAIKELKKSMYKESNKREKDVEQFIAQGGAVRGEAVESEDDHRLTLRIPKSLMHKIDIKRKERIGKISRNLWILEMIDKATKK